MFISFIVPIYNVAPYLEQCIDSLISQDIDDYEIILVDDGSTDNSGEICDRYEECNDKIKVIHKSNGGLSDARNAGIKEASGEYLALIDGDDYVERNCLASIRKTIISQDKPQVIFMKACKVCPDGRKELLDEEYDINRITGQDPDAVREYLSTLKKYPGSACSKIIKREVLQDIGLLFDKGILCEDLKFTMHLLLSADSFGYYDKDYYYYRQNRTGSLSNSITFKNYSDRMKIYSGWMEQARNCNAESEKSMLKSFAAYEYKIMLADYCKIDKQYKDIAYEWLTEHAYILQYRDDKQTKIIRTMIKATGLKNTARLLSRYLYMRDKK